MSDRQTHRQVTRHYTHAYTYIYTIHTHMHMMHTHMHMMHTHMHMHTYTHVHKTDTNFCLLQVPVELKVGISMSARDGIFVRFESRNWEE